MNKFKSFVKGAFALGKRIGSAIAVAAVAVVGTIQQAQAAVGDPPEIDLTAVTTGLTGMQVAILAVAGGVIGSAMVLGAVKWGGRWIKGLWKSFAS